MKERSRSSLFRRISFIIILVQLMVAVALLLYLTNAIGNFNLSREQVSLKKLTGFLALNQQALTNPDGAEDLLKQAQELDVRLTLIKSDGTVLLDSERNASDMDNHANRPEVIQAMATGTGQATRYSNTLKTELIYFTERIPEKSEEPGSNVMVLRLSRPLAATTAITTELWTALTVAFGGATLVSFISLLLLSRSISKRMQVAVNSAERFAAGDFTRRLNEEGPIEFSELARALNGMAENLDLSISALRVQTSETLAILQSVSDALIALDNDQRILQLNSAALEMFNLRDVDIRGRILQEVILEPSLQKAVKVALELGTRQVAEITFANGSRLAEMVAEPLLDGEGSPIGTVLALEEVTRLRQLERIRSDFAANVSHELRTPITSIAGYAEILEETEDPDLIRKSSEVIIRNVRRLSAIIEDLLSLARLEDPQRKGTLELEPLDVEPIVSAAVHATLEAAKNKNTTIRVDIEGRPQAQGTRPLLEQAIGNLLTNAIKYGDPDGTVIIRASEMPDGMTRISVEDDGPGIDSEHLERIFERFYRVDGSRSRDLGGTGLGLAIVKHIASVIGGEVGVQSRVGIGTTFQITLPSGS